MLDNNKFLNEANQTLWALTEKVIAPLNLITGSATFGGGTMEEFWPSSCQSCFNSPRLDCLRSGNIWTVTTLLQKPSFCFLKPFRGGLLVVFQIIVLLHNPKCV